MNQNYEVAIVVRKEDYDQFHAAKNRYDLINEQDEISPDHERITTSDILLGSPYGHTKIYEVEDKDNNSYIVYHGFMEWHAGCPPCDGYAAYDFFENYNLIPTDFIRIGQKYDDIVENLELDSNIVKVHIGDKREIICKNNNSLIHWEFQTKTETEEQDTDYHSKIAVAISQECKKDFFQCMKKFDQKKNSRARFTAESVYKLAQAYDNVIGDNNERYFVVHWENIAWSRYHRAFKFLKNATFPYDFIRIGEDEEDIEDVCWMNSGIIIPHIDQCVEFYDKGKKREW